MSVEGGKSIKIRVGGGIFVAVVLLFAFLVVASTVDMVSCPECRGHEFVYGIATGSECPTCKSSGKVTIFGYWLFPIEQRRREAQRLAIVATEIAVAAAAAHEADRPNHKPVLGVSWVTQKAGYTFNPPTLPTVEEVSPNSAAYRAGLRVGDFIKSPVLEQERLYMGEARMPNDKTWFRVVERWDDTMPGDTVDVRIERAGREVAFKVPLACKKCGNADACPFRRKEGTK
jgi:hypothetical protein